MSRGTPASARGVSITSPCTLTSTHLLAPPMLTCTDSDMLSSLLTASGDDSRATWRFRSPTMAEICVAKRTFICCCLFFGRYSALTQGWLKNTEN
jgi:hypothetical protein